MGTETEYALRFRPAPNVSHPGNDALFDAIRDAVTSLVHTRKGTGLADSVRRRVFTQNGGSLYYESVPGSFEGGLVEAGTPECRGAMQLLLYQKAQDRLMFEASRIAMDALAARGISGDLGLLKNCRDASGHVYGAQESYSAALASGWLSTIGWWSTLLLAIPLALLAGVFQWIVLLALLSLLLPLCALAILDAVLCALSGRDIDSLPQRYSRLFGALSRAEGLLVMGALALPTLVASAGVHLFGFRRQRRAMDAFLASRMIVTGAGSLIDGSLHRSEKAAAMRRLMRWTVAPDDRGIYEIGHLIKPLHGLTWLDIRSVLRLFYPTQRLQIGMSDSNLCQEAELLKLGTTALVLDLAEAGLLDDAPRLLDPVSAAHAFSASLDARALLVDAPPATALELQRFYQRRAAEVVSRTETVSLEARQLVERWEQTLDLLERLDDAPDALVGHLDWITKRYLLASGQQEGLDPDALKKIDLRYHELGTGYHATLEAAGLCEILVDEDAVTQAIARPPPGTPAELRGTLVRELSAQGVDASVGWHTVAIPGKVIPLHKGSR